MPSSPTTVAAKEKAILLETIENHFAMKEITLLPEEKKWTRTFTFRDRIQTIVLPSKTPSWRLRDKDAFFKIGGGNKAYPQFFSTEPLKKTHGMHEKVE
jgi:hypothetical protein